MCPTFFITIIEVLEHANLLLSHPVWACDLCPVVPNHEGLKIEKLKKGAHFYKGDDNLSAEVQGKIVQKNTLKRHPMQNINKNSYHLLKS